MVESKVHCKDHYCKDYRSHHHKYGRTLQLFPGRPRYFLGQLHIGFFNVVNELSFDIAGEAGFEPTSTVLETAELPLFYSPIKEGVKRHPHDIK